MWINLFTKRETETDVENKFMVAKGKKGHGRGIILRVRN